MNDTTLQHDLNNCQTIASEHYENFPVASWLLAKQYRQPVAVIYTFARTADDIADELEAPVTERLRQLDDFEKALRDALAGKPSTPLLETVSHTITQYQLPEQYFYDLLRAFKQDTQQTRYQTFSDVLDYCRYSANPVGRLMLHLFGFSTEKNLQLSDNICTALQLINFLQDYEQDYRENNRLYFPLDELAQFDINESQWVTRSISQNKTSFFVFQTNRARHYLQNGSELGVILPGRMGLEIRAIIQGGLAILNKLEKDPGTFKRPRLNSADKLRIITKTLFNLS